MPLSPTYRDQYRRTILICLAATLLLLIGLVRLWPAPASDSDRDIAYRVSELETIEVEDIQPTRQAQQAPPPPSPPIPVVVPNEAVLEEHELDLSDTNFLDVELPGLDEELSEGTDPVTTGGGATVGPKAVRFVEPEYTREARRRRIRAEVIVEVFIDDRGRVQETSIEERFILDKDGASKTPVTEVGYGLEEAAVSAAKRWVFRPARENGKPIASQTTLTFTFGV